MDRMEPSLYSVINASLLAIEIKVDEEYYITFLKWPENKEEKDALDDDGLLAYHLMCATFDAACFVVNDTLISYNERVVDWRIEKLKKELDEVRKYYLAGVFKKADLLAIINHFIVTFEKNSLVNIGNDYFAYGKIKWSEILQKESGIVNEHSIFNRIYWVFKDFEESIK